MKNQASEQMTAAEILGNPDYVYTLLNIIFYMLNHTQKGIMVL